MNLTKYKLGDLIVQRREKNNNYDVPIRGVSKEGFIPAKQKDADTSIYNVFYKYDFVFNPARMELNSIALNLEYDKALCSSLYEVFYVKDESIVLPEFLNLHIKRDEFARHCDYIGLGSAREYCRFANIAEFDIELPPIEVQEEIVEADRLIKKRIRLNNQMIQHLEATAQALYRKTFVDNIDKENLPEGWRMGTLGDLCVISSSKRIFESEYCHRGVPFYRGKEITQKKNGEQISDLIFISQTRYNELVRDYGKPKCGDILLTAVGTIGNSYMVQEEEFYFKDGNIVWLHNFIATGASSYIYEFFQSQSFEKLISEIAIGSTQKALTIQSLTQLEMPIPNKKSLQTFGNSIQIIYNDIKIKRQENDKLTELQSLLLAKMGQ